MLLKLLIGLQKPDSGSISIDGHEITGLDTRELNEVRKNIGFLFQEGALYDSMTIEQNVEFPLKRHTTQSPEERKKRVRELLASVGLESDFAKLPGEISGGMKKRVGIARAISMQPKYLFVDEPNSGLDPKTSILIDELINELTEEYQITTVIVTHDMNSVMGIGDHIIFLHQGKKWWEGTKDEIAHTDNKELNDFVFASKFMRAAKARL